MYQLQLIVSGTLNKKVFAKVFVDHCVTEHVPNWIHCFRT